jgi:uncharacterized membrane protein YagU involved in acid resistance
MIARLAGNVGKGLLAGLAGTAAMTVSSTLEAKLRRRELSTAPAKAAKKLLGIRSFESREAEQRFSNLVHWGYGTGWGVARGVLRTVGMPPKLATPAHYGAVWGSALVTLPALDVAPPVFLWPGKEVAIDVFHHAVYAAATGVVYELLDRSG